MFRVSVGAFLLQNSLLSPIFYAHFLRFRYYQSQFTQRAVARVKAEVDKFVTRPGSPPVLLSVWQNAQMIINRWAGSLLVQQPPPQQQQPAAAGRRQKPRKSTCILSDGRADLCPSKCGVFRNDLYGYLLEAIMDSYNPSKRFSFLTFKLNPQRHVSVCFCCYY